MMRSGSIILVTFFLLAALVAGFVSLVHAQANRSTSEAEECDTSSMDSSSSSPGSGEFTNQDEDSNHLVPPVPKVLKISPVVPNASNCVINTWSV